MNNNHTGSGHFLSGIQIFAVFVLPTLVGSAFRLPRLMLQNFTDGAFYLGYALHFRELIEIAGLYYYSVRFPAIFPDIAAMQVFGDSFGIVVWRYLLSGLCCLSIWTLFRKRKSNFIGWFAALAWISNPFALRFLQTGYSDVFGASFLLISLCLALLPSVGIAIMIAAGALAASAVWSHSHAALALIFAFPLLAVTRFPDGIRPTIAHLVAAITGALALSFSFAIFYYWNFGLWDLTAPTREVLRLLKEGYVEKPIISWQSILESNQFWLSPIPLGVSVFLVARKSLFAWAAWFGVAGYTTFLLLHDLLGGGYSLSLFYYFSFCVPCLVLALAAILVSLSAELKSQSAIGLYLSAVLLLPILMAGLLKISPFWSLLIIVFLGSQFFGKKLSPNLAGLLATFALCLVVNSPSSIIALGRYWNGDDFGLLKTAEKISEHVRANKKAGESVRFWYNDPGSGNCRMVQSFFLHEFSKWRNNDGKPWSFPEDANLTSNQPSFDGIRHIVILSENPDELKRAINFLRSINFQIDQVHLAEHPPGSVHWAHLVFSDISADATVEVPIPPAEDWVTHGRGKVESTPQGVRIRTPARRWTKAATLSFQAIAKGKQLIAISAKVRSGLLILETVHSPDAPGSSYPRVVLPSEENVQIVLPISPETPFLRIRNFAPDGVRSEIDILKLHLSKAPRNLQHVEE